MIEKLLAFILEHDHRAWIDNGKLFGVVDYGNGECETEEIRPNLHAVKAWLGY